MKHIFTALLSTLMTISLFAAGVTGKVSASVYGNNDDLDNKKDKNFKQGNFQKALNDAEFIEVYRKIKNHQTSKLGEARNAIKRHYFTSFQIKEILKIFKTDDERLGLARMAYNHVVDKNKYITELDNVLSSASIKALQAHTDRHDNPPIKDNPKALNDAEFLDIYRKVKNQPNENAQLIEARSAIKRNYFTSIQVKELLKLLKTDTDRLELARLAYHRVVNKDNFFTELDNILSPASEKDLQTYINKYRN